MLYKLFINYLRLKLLRIILNRVTGKKMGNNKNAKTMGIAPYVVELLATYMLNPRKKPK